MSRIDSSRVLFYTTCIAGFIILSFAFGLYSGFNRTAVFQGVRELKNKVEESFELVSGEATTLLKIHPEHFVQPARHEGSGVTVNKAPGGEEELILLSGFFEENNQLRLIRRDGTVIAKWPVRFTEIFPNPSHLWNPPKTDWNIDTHGALALPDGSVVFNFEYGGLVKLDRCGNLVWVLEQATHHSVELAEGGGFWVPGRVYHSEESESPLTPFQTPLKEDTIMKVSEDGKVLVEISVPKLLYENGLEPLITSGWPDAALAWGSHDEIVHLNKIAELPSDIAEDFTLFEAGDLALSLREYNMIFVVDPETRKIKWWRIGPWLRQHDPEFTYGGKIIVFSNNIFISSSSEDTDAHGHGKAIASISFPRGSNIIEIDPLSGVHKVIYGDVAGQEMFTRIRGKHEITQNGGLLITEFESGRVFETDTEGNTIWEYINRYDSDEVAEISEARVYQAGYFRVSDWACE